MSRRWQRTLPHDVYEIVDKAGFVIYVGISMNTERRLLQHRSKPWFTTASTVRISTYADLETAKRIEGRRIAQLNPKHNIQREHWAASSGPVDMPLPIESRKEEIKHGR